MDDAITELKDLKKRLITNSDLMYDPATKARVAELRKKVGEQLKSKGQ